MTAGVPVLVARGLRKAYPGGVAALDGVDLDLLPSEILGLVGENGAGKTTLLRTLAGLAAPDAGTVHLRGVDILRDPSVARGSVGVLPADDDAPPHLSAREAITLIGRLHGLGPADARGRTDDLLALFEVASRDRDRLLGTYSTGTRRKVLLACALVHAPDLLLLDEPLSGLDPVAADVVTRTLRSLALQGCSVLFSSHGLEVVEPLCGRVAVLHQGRVLACGTPAEVRVVARVDASASLLAAYVALVGRGEPAPLPEWMTDRLT